MRFTLPNSTTHSRYIIIDAPIKTAYNASMEIKVTHSKNRKRTVQGRLVGDVLEIRAPASMSDDELQPHIDNIRKRLERRKAKRTLDDDGLQRRAEQLNKEYFDGKLTWKSIKWVTNQEKRHGSCTPSLGTIRISHRLATMPQFVQDYVIVHELAHLLEANHGPDFWKLVYQFPKTERARGYLMAVDLEQIDDE